MIDHIRHNAPERQDDLRRLRESVQNRVLKETRGAKSVVDFFVDLMRGNVPNCTPSNRMAAAKLLLNLGFGDLQSRSGVSKVTGIGKRSARRKAAHDQCYKSPDHPVHPVSSEQLNLDINPVREIRVHTHDGASTVKFLIAVMEGKEPSAKVGDRIDAAKILLHLSLDDASRPNPDFALYYAPCHSDCLCACDNRPEAGDEARAPETAERQPEPQAPETEAPDNADDSDNATKRAKRSSKWQDPQRFRERVEEIDRLTKQDLALARQQELNYIRSP